MSDSLVIGSFGAIGVIGDNEWCQWMPLLPLAIRSVAPMATSIGDNGDRHCRQWMSPLAPDQIAIGNNGASIGATHCRHWRQWRQMIHSPNYLTLLPLSAGHVTRWSSYCTPMTKLYLCDLVIKLHGHWLCNYMGQLFTRGL